MASRELVLRRRNSRLLPWGVGIEKARSSNDRPLAFDDYLGLVSDYAQFGFNGVQYSLPNATQEEISGFPSYARAGFKSNAVVFSCMAVRLRLFRQARFQWQRLQNGQPGDLFGNPDLAVLETPWIGGTTADLLGRMIQYADLAGNAFVHREDDGTLFVARPDWVTIIAGGQDQDGDGDLTIWDPTAEVIGYAYTPGGIGSGEEPILWPADEVAHFAPMPDPEARFRGMSWLTPIVREVMADKAATDHKLMFFEQAATPNLVVKLDVPDLEKFKKWIEAFSAQHEGAGNAYKTMYLGAGADATVVGANLQQMDFKNTQGAGETRIAAAAGVPPVIVGLSEGLEAATYSNYGQARRAFADVTMRDLWQDAAGSLANIVPNPSTPGSPARLWYADKHISFLQEDEKDAADILFVDAQAIRQLTDAGYDAESVVRAVEARDLSLLTHTGVFSVQLQPPGTKNEPGTAPDGATNGAGSAANVPAPN